MPVTEAVPLGAADLAILRAVARFHYLTAAQLSRLLYPNSHDDSRYSQRRLKRLTDAGYLVRLGSKPSPASGSVPYVFALSRRGRAVLAQHGIGVPFPDRPSELAERARNRPFLEHTLAVLDVLIAAERLCQTHSGVRMPRLVAERELKALHMQVTVPPLCGASGPARTMTVIPDGWLQLQVGTRRPTSIALELDRGGGERQGVWQTRWRRKVAALCAWAEGPYQTLLQATNLTIAVVTPGEEERAAQLREWTCTELEARGLWGAKEEDRLDIFLFTAADPVTSPPKEFFCGPVWSGLIGGARLPLLPGTEST